MTTRISDRFAGSYAKRPIRFLELAAIGDWRVKAYGISVNNERPDSGLIRAAKRLASEKLPNPATDSGHDDQNTLSQDRYGVAVLIIHEGREGSFVLIDWWVGENMLQNHVYFSPDFESREFSYVNPTGTMACVWELRILSFERQAWIECVLANANGANLDDYCRRHFSGDV